MSGAGAIGGMAMPAMNLGGIGMTGGATAINSFGSAGNQLSGLMQTVSQSIQQAGLDLKGGMSAQNDLKGFTYDLFFGIKGGGGSMWGALKDLTELELALYLLELLNKTEKSLGSDNKPSDLIGLLILSKLQDDFSNLTNASGAVDFSNFMAILSNNLSSMSVPAIGANINVFV